MRSFPSSQVVTVIPGTSNMQATQLAYTMMVNPSRLNGLTGPTVFPVFQLVTVERWRVLNPQIGRLSDADFGQLMDLVVRYLEDK